MGLGEHIKNLNVRAYYIIDAMADRSGDLEGAREIIKQVLRESGSGVKGKARHNRAFCGFIFYECSAALNKEGFRNMKLDDFQRLFHEEVFK